MSINPFGQGKTDETAQNTESTSNKSKSAEISSENISTEGNSKQENVAKVEETPIQKVQRILAEHDYIESNIGINHAEYWSAKRQISAVQPLRQKPPKV